MRITVFSLPLRHWTLDIGNLSFIFFTEAKNGSTYQPALPESACCAILETGTLPC
jgi:hypothetical protein